MDNNLQQCDVGGLSWRSLNKPKPYAFAILIILGILLEYVVHYQLGIAVVYTHFYYLIIVLAGLWYGRRAVLIALFFGALHVAVTYFIVGIISPDAILRTCMFVIVAYVVGLIAEQIHCYHDQLTDRNRQLTEMNTRLELSQNAFETANKKLNILSSITRHDIKNQLTGLMVYIGLLKEKCTDPEMRHFIEREEVAAQAIQRQIEFTRNYENIGVHAPQWQDIGLITRGLRTLVPPGIGVLATIEGLEVFADPLLEKVFENLIDNSLRHGEHVNHISFSFRQYDAESLAIVYEDDGAGVQDPDKERIFAKGFGKHTGLGLFLSREILAISGLSIRESGIYGKGARFEILVPQGKYRSVKPITS